MRFHSRAVILLIALVSFIVMVHSISQADITISQIKLTSKGIRLKAFAILGLSGDGNVLTCYEKITDPKVIQKGYAYKFWIFEFQGDDRDKVKMTDILLPIKDFQQSWISHDGKWNLITADRGAKFLLVDIPNKKVTVIFDHKKGIPGFRSEIGNIEYFNGKYYVWGYFYNEKDVETKRGLAEVDLSKTGPEMFTLAHDTDKFEKQKNWYTEWVGPAQCFCVKRDDKTKTDTLKFYDNGKLTEMDKTSRFLAEASAANRCIYSLYRDKDTIETLIKDAVLGKTWKLASGTKPYSNMFIAREKGDTVIASLVDLKRNNISFFYAMEKDDFKLKPIEAMQNKSLRIIRLAPYGKVYATFDGTSLYRGKLE